MWPRQRAAESVVRRVIIAGDFLAAASAATVFLIEMPAGTSATTMAVVVLAAGAWPRFIAAWLRHRYLGLIRSGAGGQVGRAAVVYIALLVLTATVTQTDVSAGPLVLATGLLVAVSMLARRATTRWRASLQRWGVLVKRVLAVGTGEDISALVDRLSDDVNHPFVVMGACVEGEDSPEADLPVVGKLDFDLFPDGLRDRAPVQVVVEAAKRVGADSVCVTPGSRFSGDRLRALCWALDEHDIDVMSALGVADIDDHRMWLGRAGEVALLHVASPRPPRPTLTIKALLDRILAGVALLMIWPVLLGTAGVVQWSSPGPIFYRQQRVGRGGRRFTMLKFRTMCADADQMRDELVAASDGGPMFKMRDDPRITRVGRVLRKYSLDELPQLINVVRGEMSLVGPRPPLPEEVAGYDSVEIRRLLAVPGMTGLWQVSGRSNLSWDETVRLDLRYVENVTLRGDLKLLGRTARVVMHGEGAY
jgi:exopolysaccharide biosynthesis polyprenyl glycosylphosphotransferase